LRSSTYPCRARRRWSCLIYENYQLVKKSANASIWVPLRAAVRLRAILTRRPIFLMNPSLGLSILKHPGSALILVLDNKSQSVAFNGTKSCSKPSWKTYLAASFFSKSSLTAHTTSLSLRAIFLRHQGRTTSIGLTDSYISLLRTRFAALRQGF
jgi:hypothetical protein